MTVDLAPLIDAADKQDWQRVQAWLSKNRSELHAQAQFPRGPQLQHQPYERTVLHADPTAEVLLMGWQDGLACAPHDHGGASGAVFILTGACEETHYQFTQEPESSLKPTRSIQHAAGDWFTIPETCIHSMQAMQAQQQAVSLHIYTPSPPGMRIYDTASKRCLLVGGNCGAWIPEDDLILETEAW